MIFSQNPIIFKLDLCTINSKVCLPNNPFFFILEYADIELEFLNWGFSKKGMGMLILGKKFQNFDWVESHLI